MLVACTPDILTGELPNPVDDSSLFQTVAQTNGNNLANDLGAMGKVASDSELSENGEMDDEKQSSPDASTLRDDIRPYKCTYEGCQKAYKKPCKLLEHERTHTGERPYVCPVPGCGKSYRRSTHLSAHARTHDPENGKTFKCTEPDCSKSFYTRQHLNRHLLVHKTPKPYTCSWENCEAAFAKHNQLRRHMCEHTGKKPYVCEHEGCTQSFPTSTKLRKHQRVHNNEIKYHCGHESCDESFPKWSQLQEHLRASHANVCKTCGKRFERKSSLRQHLKTHDPNRVQIQCTWEGCEKKFLSKKSLNVHIRTSHKNIRPYACKVPGCDSTFAHKHLLVRHRRVHELAERSRKRKRETTAAEWVTGEGYEEERRLACTVEGCEYRFARNYDLERHVQSFHKQEEDYVEENIIKNGGLIGVETVASLGGMDLGEVPGINAVDECSLEALLRDPAMGLQFIVERINS
ncbi:uncharacterized protein VTP21DRAFT_9880 [Calcarisporiella thermophila]|uniref:uncharacterized protein n=1 Tax=Calcarisporiella thermophila TaxID=911321 RepID=UPI0037434323